MLNLRTINEITQQVLVLFRPDDKVQPFGKEAKAFVFEIVRDGIKDALPHHRKELEALNNADLAMRFFNLLDARNASRLFFDSRDLDNRLVPRSMQNIWSAYLSKNGRAIMFKKDLEVAAAVQDRMAGLIVSW